MRLIQSNAHGLKPMCRSVDIANPARSCRPRLCWFENQIRVTPISIKPCAAIFAVVEPIPRYVKPFIELRDMRAVQRLRREVANERGSEADSSKLPQNRCSRGRRSRPGLLSSREGRT